jgi:DNA-binding MarR family transcriptional regulator
MAGTIPKRQHAVNSPRTEAGEALSRLVVQVFRLDGALTAAGDALARPAGQTSARWRILASLEQNPLTVAQIARAWSLARQSVQRIADALERDGLVTYEDNPDHRRAKLVQLTPGGADALAQIQAAQQTWANELGEQIGAADLDAATDVLTRLLALLAEHRETNTSGRFRG